GLLPASTQNVAPPEGAPWRIHVHVDILLHVPRLNFSFVDTPCHAPFLCAKVHLFLCRHSVSCTIYVRQGATIPVSTLCVMPHFCVPRCNYSCVDTPCHAPFLCAKA
ncbi:hypothetical protein KI387_003404, partial [Taxus chinensis]